MLVAVVGVENVAGLGVHKLAVEQVLARAGQNQIDLAVALVAVPADLAAGLEHHHGANAPLVVHLFRREHVKFLHGARAALEVFQHDRLGRKLSLKSHNGTLQNVC